jgi:dCTP deaminase
MLPGAMNAYIPGVMSRRQLRTLCAAGWIQNVTNDALIDYSSVDLTLSDEACVMMKGSVKPFGGSYEHFLLSENDVAQRISPDDDGAFTLTEKKTYVFKLQQQLGPEVRNHELYGQATAKSSVGRVDVLARLIVDGMDTYETFDPRGVSNGNGHMYLEITPITFPVRVKPGTALSQLRIFYGKPDDVRIRGAEIFSSVLIGGSGDGSLTVNLSPIQVGKDHGCAFRAEAKKESGPVCLWKQDKPPDPRKYWTVERAGRVGTKDYLQITKERFYILSSQEKIALPGGIAVYCRAIDETIGEMRIHYAGFVHPFFGRNRKDGNTGTPLIFEVRGHDVEVALTQGEKMARLTFYRMSEDCEIEEPSNYDSQTLELSKFFASWD